MLALTKYPHHAVSSWPRPEGATPSAPFPLPLPHLAFFSSPVTGFLVQLSVMEDAVQSPNPLDSLSPRHRRFVEEYIIDYNATAAYLRAGFRGTRATAGRNAHVLLKNTEIDAAVKQAEKEALEQVRFRQHEVYSAMRPILSSSINNYDIEKGEVSVKEGVDPSAIRAVSSVHKKSVTRMVGYKEETTHEVRLTLWNKNDVIKMAGQTLGMFVDKLAPTTPDGKEEYGGSLTDEERANRVVALLERGRTRRDRDADNSAE